MNLGVYQSHHLHEAFLFSIFGNEFMCFSSTLDHIIVFLVFPLKFSFFLFSESYLLEILFPNLSFHSPILSYFSTRMTFLSHHTSSSWLGMLGMLGVQIMTFMT